MAIYWMNENTNAFWLSVIFPKWFHYRTERGSVVEIEMSGYVASDTSIVADSISPVSCCMNLKNNTILLLRSKFTSSMEVS